MNRNACRMTRKGGYDSASDRACSGMLTCRLLSGPKLNQSGAQAPTVDIENLLGIYHSAQRRLVTLLTLCTSTATS